MAKKLAIIASKGTLDWAYPPFILASTAAALDYEVQIFFTFYGLTLLKKELDAKISPLGNPAMPMPVPMPNLVQVLPGWGSLGHMQVIRVDPKTGAKTAGADPRRTGYAMGY